MRKCRCRRCQVPLLLLLLLLLPLLVLQEAAVTKVLVRALMLVLALVPLLLAMGQFLQVRVQCSQMTVQSKADCH